jgi:DNA-binding transcriptional regulator YhcF (GntR family)
MDDRYQGIQCDAVYFLQVDLKSSLVIVVWVWVALHATRPENHLLSETDLATPKHTVSCNTMKIARTELHRSAVINVCSSLLMFINHRKAPTSRLLQRL